MKVQYYLSHNQSFTRDFIRTVSSKVIVLEILAQSDAATA